MLPRRRPRPICPDCKSGCYADGPCRCARGCEKHPRPEPKKPVSCTYCGRTVAKNHRLTERTMKGWDKPFVGHLKCWQEMRSAHNDPARWDVKEGR